MNIRRRTAFFFIVVIAFIGCGSSNKEAVAPAMQQAPMKLQKTSAPAMSEAAEDKPAAMPRKIIKNGEVGMVVKHYEPFFNSLQKQVTQMGGYISQIQVALRFETRLQEMLKTQTGKLQDVMLVEEKLNQVREQIEQFEGKLRYFDNLVGMATLTVSVRVEEKYVPPKAPTFGDRASRVWKDSVYSLKNFIQGVGLFVIAIVPWIIPIAVMLVIARYILRFLWRMLRRKL